MYTLAMLRRDSDYGLYLSRYRRGKHINTFRNTVSQYTALLAVGITLISGTLT